MYANLVTPLIEAVKQLDSQTDDRFDKLEARLATIEAENAALRAQLAQR